MSKELNAELVKAVRKGDIETVKRLLADGAIPNLTLSINGSEMNLIHIATVCGHLEVIEELLAADVDIEVRDVRGMTPLNVAALYGHDKIAKLLITAGANKESTEFSQGLRPIHFAAIRGNEEVLVELLESGADKNALDSLGVSPLLHAHVNGHTCIVKKLLDAGVDSADYDLFQNLFGDGIRDGKNHYPLI